MNRKNMTRNALFTSLVSLLLCVSMLVGTTFAWFTDEVTTGMNTIAAGNLDVELLAGGTKVDGSTKLFNKVDLWEPGVVLYENLQVANVGTLALKYQMTLNFGNENDLNGHKLSEVLKVAVIDKVTGTDRQAVLAAAKAANPTALSGFSMSGELEAGASSTEKAVVIYWEPNDNAIDNLYNANNGKKTSDGEPLHIEFGVILQATQKMHEEDSFGKDYDEFASILPTADVTEKGPQTVKVHYTSNYAEDEIALDTTFQLKPTQSEEAVVSSPYRFWHADFVVYTDKDVAPESLALAGYYEAWCGNDGWVVMTSTDTIPAGTEIRLLDDGLGVTMNYEEISQLMNDGIGFLCGAANLSGCQGTTLTAELRLYETEAPSDANGNSTNVETGHYVVAGTYSYTF